MATFNAEVKITNFNEINAPTNPPVFAPDDFANALTLLVNAANKNEQTYLDDAIHSAKVKNENGFIEALKKVAALGGDILTRVSSEALVSYLRVNGIIH